jgi:RNA polymerase sigma factor (sigma-70 family)
MASTTDLLARARAGDRQAVDVLFSRYLPLLRRWARGRLPQRARDLRDTDDLVQETLIHTLRRLDAFEMRHEGALQAYLRQAIVNRVRDEVRRAGRSPVQTDVIGHEDAGPGGVSPLEEAIGHEALERYERALGRLRPEEREAVIARVELGHRYEDVATALGKPSADAARMAVSRALVRLAEEMNREA